MRFFSSAAVKSACTAGLSLSLSACATVPVGVVYTNVKASRAYRAPTPAEVKTSAQDPVVVGASCAEGVLGLVAWGEAGYAEAVTDALKGQSTDKVLYDVKSDIDAFAILGIVYQKLCTRVSGKVGSLLSK